MGSMEHTRAAANVIREQCYNLEMIDPSVPLLLQRINVLLDVVWLEAGSMGRKCTTFDLAQLLRITAVHLDVLAQSKTIPFTLGILPPFCPELMRRRFSGYC